MLRGTAIIFLFDWQMMILEIYLSIPSITLFVFFSYQVSALLPLNIIILEVFDGFLDIHEEMCHNAMRLVLRIPVLKNCERLPKGFEL